MRKPQIEALALFAIPGACLLLSVFAVAGLGCFLYGHFGDVAQMAHFGKVLMAPFGLALCAVFFIEICLWFCALIIYAIDPKRGSTSKTDVNAQSSIAVIEQNVAEPEQTGERSTTWDSAWAYVVVFMMLLALIGLVPLLRGVYQQERGLIAIGAWLVAPYGLFVAAWYIAIQISHLTWGVYRTRTNVQAQ